MEEGRGECNGKKGKRRRGGGYKHTCTHTYVHKYIAIDLFSVFLPIMNRDFCKLLTNSSSTQVAS